MNIKVIRNIAIGIGAYAIFATSILFYYQDHPEARSWDDREDINLSYIAGLSLDENLNKKMIIEKLGTPDISESKQTENSTVTVLFYRTQHIKADGNTTIDECTALLFKNNQLIAWGQNAYQQYKDEQLATDK
ncbi:MAG: hypothetical protein ACI9IA_000574 [Enterobacterales bacterium]|jgi:hypothetical protein